MPSKEIHIANGRFPMPVSNDPSPKVPPARSRINMVDHPPHYNQGTMEAIDIIEAVGLGYHLSNAFKYLIRSPYKGHEKEDLEKAIWYINRHIDRNIDAQ